MTRYRLKSFIKYVLILGQFVIVSNLVSQTVNLRIFLNRPADIYIDDVRIGYYVSHTNSPIIIEDLSIGDHFIKAIPVSGIYATQIFEKKITLKYGIPNSIEINFREIERTGILALELSIPESFYDEFRLKDAAYNIVPNLEEYRPYSFQPKDGARFILFTGLYDDAGEELFEIVNNRAKDDPIEMDIGEYEIYAYARILMDGKVSGKKTVIVWAGHLPLVFNNNDKYYKKGTVIRNSGELDYMKGIKHSSIKISIKPGERTILKIIIDKYFNFSYEIY